MWDLSGLPVADARSIEYQLGQGGLWSVLLFRYADEKIRAGLEQNWQLFHTSLGSNAHVITLLNVKQSGTKASLKFPEDYESAVGGFCNSLKVPIDKLPALVLLNGKQGEDGKPPYWSLRRATLKEGSDALVSLIADMQTATDHGPPPQDEPLRTQWLEKATERLLWSASGKQFISMAVANPEVLRSALKRLLSFLTGTPIL